MIRRIEAWPNLSDERTRSLIETARHWRETDPISSDELNWASWEVVRNPGLPTDSYEIALLQAQAAKRASPTDGNIVNTLGVAQYRVGEYAAALETLMRSDKMNSDGPDGSLPADIAFLAMTQHQLGKPSEARATLDRLRDVVKGDDWVNDDETQAFAHEAQSLIEHDSL